MSLSGACAPPGKVCSCPSLARGTTAGPVGWDGMGWGGREQMALSGRAGVGTDGNTGRLGKGTYGHTGLAHPYAGPNYRVGFAWGMVEGFNLFPSLLGCTVGHRMWLWLCAVQYTRDGDTVEPFQMFFSAVFFSI